MIEVKNCTMLYSSKKGVTDVSFNVREGEVFGYLGPNGAGKTTTIRCMLGFMKAQEGKIIINGLDSWADAAKIQSSVGYIPGEMSLFDEMTGIEFLNFLLQMRGVKDKTRLNELLVLFDLDPKGIIRKMSKGMKQKVGLIAAFMHDPQVYILDEPSSGLDPLMQQVFVNLIKEERKRGKTILMSSHSFEEVDKTCDRIAMIRDGKIVLVEDIEVVKKHRRKIFSVSVSNPMEIAKMKQLGISVVFENDSSADVEVLGDFGPFFEMLKQIDVVDLDVKTQRLEDIFMHFYGKEDDFR
ncbi:MAG: ABC transporter ATP-binding protein [Erysipelotrichaceae bacterium]|nr:ABC transporter ATP-binding protein [Erysipelotrichaceae bacterium]MDP3306055.1 ABC transporter ATP-binding protein [Erysipelotrichaceae bacterium]